MTPENMSNLYGRERLIRNEVNVLVGLLVKNKIDYSLPAKETIDQYVKRSHALLDEIHEAMLVPVVKLMSAEKGGVGNLSLQSGAMLREAIFYGGESAYMFQYRDFAPQRYGRDDPWMIANKGFSMRDAAAVVKAVGGLRNEKITMAFNAIKNAQSSEQTYLPSYEFSAAEIAGRARVSVDVAERVLSEFAYPVGERNAQFKAVDDRNLASIFPLIRHDDQYLFFNIFDLSEVLYQAPYFWMLGDEPYQPSASEHRGKFTEDFAESCLVSVFGRNNVKTNVNLVRSKSIIGEIDVLVFFGDLAIILQAKSKQLTAMARQGNEAKLKEDFGAAVQAASDQGYSCGQLLLDSSIVLKDPNGTEITAPVNIKRIYVICLIADHYPALAFQASQFLKFNPAEKLAAPFVMDVFLLDAMAEMLDTPLHFLSYLDRRTSYHEKFMASHELNILGYHLGHNLWMNEKYDRVHLDDDVGKSLELSMLVRRENIPGPWTPPGILTRMEDTRLGKLIKEIEREPNPGMLALGFLILRMGEKTVVELSDAINELMRRAMADGKPHNLSIQLSSGRDGLTIHVNSNPIDVAERNILCYCTMRKYVQRSDDWFGIVVAPDTGAIRFGVHTQSPWVKDPEMDILTREMQKSPSAKRIVFPKFAIAKKVGRNDPCPCGSGKKSKRCCHA